MSKRQIILASQSPQRKEMLSTLGIEFEVKPADVDEQGYQISDLAQRAQDLALMKAEVVTQDHPQAIVIAADTYGDFDGQALEKPENLAQAREMLKLQSGNWLKGYTGFAYLDLVNNVEINKVAEFKFLFRPLSEQEIEYYINNNPVTTWSAAFAPAHPSGAALIEHVDGSLTAFTHGLPMEWVVEGLRESGVSI